jgi:class 3 adenylate cyclase
MDWPSSRAAPPRVEAHGGKVLQYAGDSLLAAFGAEHSREDDAERAVKAGLALLDEGAREGQAVERRFGTPASACGSACTPARCCLGGGVDADGSIRGITVNVAARMEQSAPPRRAAHQRRHLALVRGAFETERQEPIAVKGLDAPSSPPGATGIAPRASGTGARHRGAVDADGRPRCRARCVATRGFERIGRERIGALSR